MRTGPPPSPPRYVSRAQRLLSNVELAASRSIGAKKRAVKRFTSWSKPVPPSLAPYAAGSSSCEGSSRRPPSPSPSPPPESDSSGYCDYASLEESDSYDPSSGDRVVERDFVTSDAAEERAFARLRRRYERALFNEQTREDRELAETLRLIERQKEEEAAVERLKRQKEEEAAAEPLKRARQD